MSSPFFERLEKLDKVVAAGPERCDYIRDVAPYLSEPASTIYFFDALKTPEWLDVLIPAQVFVHIPEPESDPESGSLSFPFWSPATYLARIAPEAPDRVLGLVLDMPDTANVYVRREVIKIALALPPQHSAKIIPKVKGWVSDGDMLLPNQLGELVSCLARGGELDAAFDLGRVLLSIKPDRGNDEQSEEGSESLHLKSRAHLDVWNYEQIVTSNLPDLLSADRVRTFALLCELLGDAVYSPESERDERPFDDYSYIWRPAIEDHSQNQPTGVRDILVTAVRNAAERIVEEHIMPLNELVTFLEDQSWVIFWRTSLYLLRRFPDEFPDLVARHLTNRRLFDAAGLHHEYGLLLRERFGDLSPDDQAIIVGWIDVGPHSDLVNSAYSRWHGRAPTPDEHEDYKGRWQLESLELIKSDLAESWKHRYQDLVEKFGMPDHPEFLVYGTVAFAGSGDRSPNLASKTIEAVIAELQTSQSAPESIAWSSEAMARELTTLVANKPEEFAKQSPRFRGLRARYVNALLSGLWDAVRQDRSFSWESVLQICGWVIKEERDANGPQCIGDDTWAWARQLVANLLSSGLEERPTGIPPAFRSNVWDILGPLTDDPDPAPEAELTITSPAADPATASLNSIRGVAMHGVVHYALWVDRHIRSTTVEPSTTVTGFQTMPEVRSVLERHLDVAQERSLAVRSIYGRWFPWLVLLDSEWARLHVQDIFPEDEKLRDLHEAAWDTYLRYCTAYDTVFDILQREYEQAVGRIGLAKSGNLQQVDTDERLAEHLIALYWRGRLDLEDTDGLVGLLYRVATPQLRGHVIDFTGRILYNSKEAPPSEVLDRLRRLWELRVEAAGRIPNRDERSQELAAFGWWFASGKLSNEWSLEQLQEVLRIASIFKHVDLVLDRLAELVLLEPSQVLLACQLLVETEPDYWAISAGLEKMKAILEEGLRSRNEKTQRRAANLVHILGAQGHTGLRSLLTGNVYETIRDNFTSERGH